MLMKVACVGPYDILWQNCPLLQITATAEIARKRLVRQCLHGWTLNPTKLSGRTNQRYRNSVLQAMPGEVFVNLAAVRSAVVIFAIRSTLA